LEKWQRAEIFCHQDLVVTFRRFAVNSKRLIVVFESLLICRCRG